MCPSRVARLNFCVISIGTVKKNRSNMQYQQDGSDQPRKENSSEQSFGSTSGASSNIVAQGEGWIMIQASDSQLKTITIE